MAWIIVTYWIAKLSCRLQTVRKFQVIHHAFLKCHELNHWGPHIQRHSWLLDFVFFSSATKQHHNKFRHLSRLARFSRTDGIPLWEDPLFWQHPWASQGGNKGRGVWEEGPGLLERREGLLGRRGGSSGKKGRGFWEEGVGLLERRGGAPGKKGRGFWEEGAGLLGGRGGASGKKGRGFWEEGEGFWKEGLKQNGCLFGTMFLKGYICSSVKNIATFICWRHQPIRPIPLMPWLLMVWGHKEPGHQQPWYWPSFIVLFRYQKG